MRVKEKTRTNNLKIVTNVVIAVTTLLIVVTVWAFSWYYIKNEMGFTDEQWDRRGQFGDMFGSVNALFSGLAFAGIIFTIYLQMQELAEQRKEFKEQTETMWLQRFEVTFFNLLSLHNKVVDDLKHEWYDEKISDFKFKTGKEAFLHIIVDVLTAVKDIPFPDEQGKLKETYEKLASGFILGLNNYIQSLTRIIVFVKDSDLLIDDERPFYLSIIVSNLSDAELSLLYYHLTFVDGYGGAKQKMKKLRRLIIELKLLSDHPPYTYHASHSEFEKYWSL
jgi:hypothetical protein